MSAEQVGAYRLLERLTDALWRELYLASGAVDGAHTTLWVCRDPDAARRERWLAAASAAASFVHPDLLRIAEAGRDGDAVFAALQPAVRPLAATAGPPAPLDLRLTLADRLCGSVAIVHEAGLVHGDIVPDAVFLDGDGRVWLTPPGWAGYTQIHLDEPPRARRYVSPEQLNGRPLDHRSDVFMVGAVLYLLLTGRDAFAGAEPEEVRTAILGSAFEPLASAERLLQPLQEVIGHALAQSPDARPQDAAVLLADLRAAIAAVRAGQSPAATPRSAGPRDGQHTADAAAGGGMPEGFPVTVAPPSGPAAPQGTAASEPVDVRDDNVQFTLYRPRTLEPGRWQPLLVFAHLAERRADAPPDEPDPAEVVATQAAAILGDMSAFRQHSEDSAQPVPREGDITFVPAADGVDFNPPSRTFRWTESVHREEFRMRAGAAVAGRVVHGRVSVYLGSIVLAEIGMNLRVGGHGVKDEAEATESARPYRKIFASYSHRDRVVVEEFSEYARAVGDRYLIDVRDLRSGERWQPALEQLIRQADVFQLFWSWHALESAFVRQEWQYALSLRRSRFVRPVYWDDPLPEQGDLPPDALRALHFERIRPARRAGAGVRSPVPVSPPAADRTRAAPPPAAAPLPRSSARPASDAAGEAPGRTVPPPVVLRDRSAPTRPRGWRLPLWPAAFPALAALALIAVLVPRMYEGSGTGPSPSGGPGGVANGDSPGVASGQPSAGAASEPRVPELVARAEAAWLAGDSDSALAMIERAASRAPADPHVTRALAGMISEAQGRLDRATAVAAGRGNRGQALKRAELQRVRADRLAKEGNTVASLRELVMAADALEQPGR